MYKVPKIESLSSQQLEEAARILDTLAPESIRSNNWPERSAYVPEVSFRMAHNGPVLFIKFVVDETCTLAQVEQDNGQTWTDSCVEFFLSLDDSGYYYNFEFTCIGKALLGFRKERPAAEHAPAGVMRTIGRYSTLGTENFSERKGNNHWELTVAIPAGALFRHRLGTWSGIPVKANLYKCGDKLSRPHYLSWQPIDTPKPDFHVARCFSPISFGR